MFLACVASLGLVNANVGMVKVMMVATAASILILAVVGFLTRRPIIASVLVTLSVGYIVIADGGTFPSAERYLPSEWALENCCDSHMLLGNACKRSRSSLTQWGLAIDSSHPDWQYANEGHINPVYSKKTLPEHDTDATLDDLLDLVDSSSSNGTTGVATTVKLPVLALANPVTVVITIYKRDDPQNIPFFIVGHCLVVITITAIAIIYFCSVGKRGRALSNKPNTLHTLHVPKLTSEH